jgi:hypothetical protein
LEGLDDVASASSERVANRINRSPMRIKSPFSSTACCTGWEFTYVPLRLPQSSMCQRSARNEIRACSRLARSSSIGSSRDGCRPSVTGAADVKCRVWPGDGPFNTISE